MKYQITKIRLHRCFHDIVLKWYEVELKSKKRDILKQNHQLNNWERNLIARFKIDQFEVMNLFIKNNYIVENVRSKRFVDAYVQQMIRHAKNAEFTSLNNQFN